jgi:hypothetical protein
MRGSTRRSIRDADRFHPSKSTAFDVRIIWSLRGSCTSSSSSVGAPALAGVVQGNRTAEEELFVVAQAAVDFHSLQEESHLL